MTFDEYQALSQEDRQLFLQDIYLAFNTGLNAAATKLDVDGRIDTMMVDAIINPMIIYSLYRIHMVLFGSMSPEQIQSEIVSYVSDMMKERGDAMHASLEDEMIQNKMAMDES